MAGIGPAVREARGGGEGEERRGGKEARPAGPQASTYGSSQCSRQPWTLIVSLVALLVRSMSSTGATAAGPSIG